MYKEKRQQAIELFHGYILACDQLYAAKEKNGKGDSEECANQLELNWEKWQLVTNSINAFLLKGIVYRHK
ncbi:MAG: hypothetical protein WCJ85_12470 [Chitinophagaceae bacterium]